MYNLSKLRKGLNVALQTSFIVQSETIRKNLDPQGKFTDEELRSALIDAGLNVDSRLVVPGINDSQFELDFLAGKLSEGQ